MEGGAEAYDKYMRLSSLQSVQGDDRFHQSFISHPLTFRFLVLFFAVLPVTLLATLFVALFVVLVILLLFFRVVPFVFLSLLRPPPSRGDRRIPEPDTPLTPPPPRDHLSFPFRLMLLSRESSLRLSRSRSRRERES